jgi:hypothetical protein
MIRRGSIPGFALCVLTVSSFTTAAEPAFEVPHSTDLALDFKARKRDHRAGIVEPSHFLDLTPGLDPLVWPRNSDVRARLVTPELRRTPLVGWIASSLYRSRKDSGWCLEVDPGEGEYLVFYRLNLK